MSQESIPITPTQFTLAIRDLPLETLYAKTHELNNSITHLQRSNTTLQEYSDSIKNDASIDVGVRADGDRDCLDAIRENEVVIERQRGRIRLIKGEVERRGQVWHEREPEGEGERREVLGHGDGSGVEGQRVENGNGDVSTSASASADAGVCQTAGQSETQVSGRLTDEELRRQVENLYPQDGADDEGGMHL